MILEHALTYKDKLSCEELNYLVRKAHTLGLSNRMIYNVFCQKEDEGIHIYFQVDELKEKNEK